MIERKTIKNDELYLRKVSSVVDKEDKNIKKDIELLKEFCLANEFHALASVQIGIPKRIIYLKNTTLDIPLEEKSYNEAKVLINPRIVLRKGHTQYWESCVSCLDNFGLVNRPYEMDVEYFDDEWNSCKQKFIGFEATVLSHEIDHLDGILHMDIAEELLYMPVEERMKYRESHPYKIISKDCDFDL